MADTILLEQQQFPKFPDVFHAGSVLTRPYRLALNFYQRKIRLHLEKGRYTVKTVSEPSELEKVLQLRHEVFYQEKTGKRSYFGIDLDRYDFTCDHLMVMDRLTGAVAGTYRLNSSLFSKSFYSASEFSIDNILRLRGTKLELGRACIQKDFRNGMTIALLWKGISEYMKLTGTQYLFGCSSIDTTDPAEINMINRHFSDTYYSPEHLRVYPRKKYAMQTSNLMQNFILSQDTSDKPRVSVPPLLNSYLKAGAVICGEPAVDKYFCCTDFFTLLNVDCMNKSVERRYS